MFEEYWGNKAQKWNGKLDIKQFSFEVWQDTVRAVIARIDDELKETEDMLDNMEPLLTSEQKSTKAGKVIAYCTIRDILCDSLFLEGESNDER